MEFKKHSDINKNYKKIGFGTEAIIYEYNKNELLKIFWGSLDEDNLKRINSFKEIDTDHFAFPTEEVYINSKLKGYKMNFKKGTKFNSLDYSLEIEALIEALKKLRDDIVIISDNNVSIYDLHDANILFNNSDTSINIIDTSQYGLNAPDFITAYKHNCRVIASLIFRLLSIPLDNINYINEIDKIINIIISKKDYLENFFDNKIDSIKEMKLNYKLYNRKIYNSKY